MINRRPLDPACTGGILCPVTAHVTITREGHNRRSSHIRLTRKQRKTLRERQLAADPQPPQLIVRSGWGSTRIGRE